MKFSEYVQLREANNAELHAQDEQEITAIFDKAAAEINNLFQVLYTGTKNMVLNFQRASLPEVARKKIVDDLRKVATYVNKMDGTPHQVAPKTETYVAEIAQLLREAVEQQPEALQGLGTMGKNAQGQAAYNFQSAITHIRASVMERMARLKDAVLKHLGQLRDMGSGITHLKNKGQEVNNRVQTLSTATDQGFSAMHQGFDKLANPMQPISPREHEGLEDSLHFLTLASNRFPKNTNNFKLIAHDGTEIEVTPKRESWKFAVSRMANKHKIFTLIDTAENKKEEINIGNSKQLIDVLNDWGYGGVGGIKLARPRENRRQAAMEIDPVTGKPVLNKTAREEWRQLRKEEKEKEQRAIEARRAERAAKNAAREAAKKQPPQA